MLILPEISPVALKISVCNSSIDIYWYGLSYVFGIIFSLHIAKKIENEYKVAQLGTNDFDNLTIYLIFGIIIGGRLGYVVFYAPSLFLFDFLEVFNIRGGGLSFHGGLIGVAVANAIFSYRNNKGCWQVNDIISCVAPIGIFFGRIANFINAELIGRKTKVWWGVVFPHDGEIRHPSQIYEACFEGLVLFTIMLSVNKITIFRLKKLNLTGIFLLFYSLFRFFLEFYRQPDDHLGFFFAYFTMGQILSVPMFLLGVFLLLSRIISFHAAKQQIE
jgi:phosphatidylglycerol:prolipoprotein diacylglycerol transferase